MGAAFRAEFHAVVPAIPEIPPAIPCDVQLTSNRSFQAYP
jgi:hypothetical protein